MKIKSGQKYIVLDSNTVFGGRVGIVVDIETYPHDTNDVVNVDEFEFDGEDTAGFRVGLDIDLSGWAFDTCPYFSINELKPIFDEIESLVVLRTPKKRVEHDFNDPMFN